MNGWQIFIEVPGKPPYELRPGESIVGRSRTTQIQVADSTVSRQHARLLSTGLGEVSLEDLGSSNGSWVNGEKIEGRKRLGDGDRVQVGDVELRVRIVAPIAAQEATVRMKIPPRPPAGPAAPPPAPPAAASPEPAPPPAAPAPAPAAPVAAPADLEPPPAAPAPSPAVARSAPPAPPVPPEAPVPNATVPVKSMPEEALAPPPPPAAAPKPPAPPRPAPVAPPPATPRAAPAPPPEPPRAVPAPPSGPRPPKDDSPFATPPVDLPIDPTVDARPAASSEVLGSIDEPPPEPGSSSGPSFAAGPVRPGSELPSVTVIDRIPIPDVSPAVIRASRLSRAKPAGFGVRVGAFVVDWLLVAALLFGASIALGSTLRLNPGLAAVFAGVSSVVPFLYVLVFWSLRGATPGKMLLGLEIVPDGPSIGRGLGVGTSLVRALGYLLSTLLLGVGFLLPLFTSKKQALHDLIAKTRVVRLS